VNECFPGEYQPSRCGAEPRRRWISIVRFSRPVALKFGDEDLQFFFRQVQQIALGQIGAAALEFGIFAVPTRSIISARDLTTRKPAAITGRRPLSA
jgi:hypothetical protein